MKLSVLNLLSFFLLIDLICCLLLPLEISGDIEKVKFYLYPNLNNSNQKEEIKYTDRLSVETSSLKRGALTIFIIPGFNTPFPKIVMDGFLKASPFTDANYIFVDWTALSAVVISPFDIPILYLLATENVAPVGKRLGNFLEWMYYEGYLDIDRVHLIGISLGSHVAGGAGRHIQAALGGRKIPRISGLDPAGPLYYPSKPGVNINKGDANFVDIYHSNIGFLGEVSIDGHADFIINNGHQQPGCNFITDLLTCSHNYAVFMFINSMKKAYPACQCSDEELDAENFKLCMNLCPNAVFAGVYVPQSTRGQYHVHTENFIKPLIHNFFNQLIG